jgi:hypothetical protein
LDVANTLKDLPTLEVLILIWVPNPPVVKKGLDEHKKPTCWQTPKLEINKLFTTPFFAVTLPTNTLEVINTIAPMPDFKLKSNITMIFLGVFTFYIYKIQ